MCVTSSCMVGEQKQEDVGKDAEDVDDDVCSVEGLDNVEEY